MPRHSRQLLYAKAFQQPNDPTSNTALVQKSSDSSRPDAMFQHHRQICIPQVVRERLCHVEHINGPTNCSTPATALSQMLYDQSVVCSPRSNAARSGSVACGLRSIVPKLKSVVSLICSV
jgi:hypothetical protein